MLLWTSSVQRALRQLEPFVMNNNAHGVVLALLVAIQLTDRNLRWPAPTTSARSQS
jgi:hypothetical protein